MGVALHPPHDLELRCVGGGGLCRAGVFIISPSHQGGRLHSPTPQLRALCAPLTPIQFHTLWLLSQPGVCTLSMGVETAEEMADHQAGRPARISRC